MANRTFTVEKGGSCGSAGRTCPTASNITRDEFNQGINARSSPTEIPMQEQDDSYRLPAPGGRGTRVIKRTRVTRTSTDPDDPELQNNTLSLDGQDRSFKSHGSSGPESYDSYQGYHDSSLNQKSVPPMHKRPYRQNYDDITAPAHIRMDRGPATPKSHCFPAYPQSDSQDRTNHSSPRSAYSTGYASNSLMMESAAAAYGRSFDPGRVVMDPRTDNQTAPGAINASLMSSGGRSICGNQRTPTAYDSKRMSPRSAYSSGYAPNSVMMRSAPAAYGRSFDPANVIMDPRTDNQTAPGAMNASLISSGGRSICGNQRTPTAYDSKRTSPRSAYSSGYTPHSLMMRSGPAAHGRSFDPANVIMDPRTDNQTAPGAIDASLLGRSGRGGCPNQSCGSHGNSGGASGYDASGESSRGQSFGPPILTPPRPHIGNVSYHSDSSQNQTPSNNSFNSVDYRTPERYPKKPQTMPTHSKMTGGNITDMSCGAPGYYINQPMQKSIGKVNNSGRSQSLPPQSMDYIAMIEDGGLSPTSKKKKIVRQATSTGSVVSEECEEIYDIPEEFGRTGMNPTNFMHSFDGKSFDPMSTSSPKGSLIPCLDRSGIEPALRGMPHYIGRADRPAPRGNQSSTINDSDFNSTGINSRRSPCSVTKGYLSSTISDGDFDTYQSSGSSGKKGSCCCKKKGGKKGSPNYEHSPEQVSKCEDIGTPCNEKKSHSSNRSGGGASEDPVSVFQAGRYDISAEANATHSVTPAADSKTCICKGGSISLDLERIEQEEFTQLTRNLSQWQQSRRKVVAKMDSVNNPSVNPASCSANCATLSKQNVTL